MENFIKNIVKTGNKLLIDIKNKDDVTEGEYKLKRKDGKYDFLRRE